MTGLRQKLPAGLIKFGRRVNRPADPNLAWGASSRFESQDDIHRGLRRYAPVDPSKD